MAKASTSSGETRSPVCTKPQTGRGETDRLIAVAAQTEQMRSIRGEWTTQRIWFPEVFLRKLIGHAQGIAIRVRPRPGSPVNDVTAFCSVSNFPAGWGAVLINTNHSVAEPDVCDVQ